MTELEMATLVYGRYCQVQDASPLSQAVADGLRSELRCQTRSLATGFPLLHTIVRKVFIRAVGLLSLRERTMKKLIDRNDSVICSKDLRKSWPDLHPQAKDCVRYKDSGKLAPVLFKPYKSR